MPAHSAIPEGYTFLNTETLITVKGKHLAEELLEQAEKRDPDAHDMYIYNDFYSYAILDLVDSTLTSLHTKVVTKKVKDAYPILEALVMFASYESVWTQCDDGKRTVHTFKAISALFVALMRKIEEAGELDTEHYPSLECLLKNMVNFCKDFKDFSGKFELICRAFARLALKEKTDEDLKTEVAMLKEWAASLDDKEMKKLVQADIKKKARKIGTKSKAAWYATGDVIDIKDNSPDFKYTGVWKRYRDYLSGCPNIPFRGPPFWDLTDWTHEQKRPFLFSSMDLDD